MKGFVRAYSGPYHPTEPREFHLSGVRHSVSRVLFTCIEETPGLEGVYRQKWRVLDQYGTEYVLTYHRTSGFWDIEER